MLCRWATAAGLLRRYQPRNGVATITAIALAAAAVGFGGPMVPDTFSSPSLQRAGMAELFRSYDPDTGLIGNSWWQSAVALSTVETYAQTTGDTSYDFAIAQAFMLHSGTRFENSADDDTAWWAIVWLRAYDMTHITSYLDMAETEANYIHQAWDDTCGGGVWWQRSPRSYKNAITNELFLELTAWLHNSIPADVKYLSWAQAEWSWFDHSGMINKDNLVNDGLSDNCSNNGGITWTYNQGVILAGLAQLYQATGDRSLLTEAERIAGAAVRRLTVHGVLAEPCEGTACAGMLDANTLSFKGVFVQDLKVLAETAKTTEFNAFFYRQARSVETRDTTSNGGFGMSWAGPTARVSPATQASALNALVAAMNLPTR